MFDLERFIAQHERALHNFALSLTKSEDESDDLLQETWIKSMGYQAMLENMTEQKQRSWLFTVLKNRWLDILRHRKLGRMINSQIDNIPTVTPSSYQWEPHLAKLPDLEREIVHKRFWMEQNSRQISEEMGIPEGTVRWRLKLAMDKLKTLVLQSKKEEQCLL